MADLQAIVNRGKISKNDLSKARVTEYIKTCGEQGLGTFQEKVLSMAFRYFTKNYQLLVKEILDVIEHAGDCKSSEIESYLKSVKFGDNKNPDTLGRSIKKLERLLIIYNEGKES